MKKIFTFFAAMVLIAGVSAQTCDYQLLGFANDEGTIISELNLSLNEDFNPAVIFFNAGPDMPGANDSLYLDMTISMGGQEAPGGSMFVPGSVVASWGNDTMYLSGNDPIFTAAQMNDYQITGFTFCYTVRASGNVTDPNTENNQACLTVVRGGNGIEGFSAESINVYPNPANNVINVANAENAQVSVFDVNGRVMFNTESASANQTIDATNFANGLYIVRIVENGNVMTKKINVVK